MGPLAIAWSEGDWLAGSGKLEQCFIGKIILTRKSINERLPFKIIIPSFHLAYMKHVPLKMMLFQ
jgi:hypothetical protein